MSRERGCVDLSEASGIVSSLGVKVDEKVPCSLERRANSDVRREGVEEKEEEEEDAAARRQR